MTASQPEDERRMVERELNYCEQLEAHIGADGKTTNTNVLDLIQAVRRLAGVLRQPPQPMGDVGELVRRLRKPVMLHSDPEQTNAERREAADALMSADSRLLMQEAALSKIEGLCDFICESAEKEMVPVAALADISHWAHQAINAALTTEAGEK